MSVLLPNVTHVDLLHEDRVFQASHDHGPETDRPGTLQLHRIRLRLEYRAGDPGATVAADLKCRLRDVKYAAGSRQKVRAGLFVQSMRRDGLGNALFEGVDGLHSQRLVG